MALTFVPGFSAPHVDPELVLQLFLPPLLFATARNTSWSVFRRRWVVLLLMAVVLTALTAVLAALVGFGVGACHRGLDHLTRHVPAQVLVSLVTPFAAYLLAEELHASGVIAVVVTALETTAARASATARCASRAATSGRW